MVLDVGELVNRPATGVKATTSIEELIALRPDAAVYTPFTGDVDDVVKLLENGVNVISTNLFFHVGGIRGEVKDRMQAAGERGNASIYITGVNSGWINQVLTSMTAVCRKVDSIAIMESGDATSYPSAETWNFLGFGLESATPEVLKAAETWLVMFRDAAERMGEALGYKFDEVTFDCKYAAAAERIDLGWFVIEKGHNAALRAGWNAKVNGKTVVRTQVTWWMSKTVAEGWDISDDEYHLVVKGEPGIDIRLRFDNPKESSDGNIWDPNAMTAMPTVNALFQLKNARPGVLGILDMGLPHAPVGLWKH